MSVTSFLTQSARVLRPSQTSSDTDGQPVVSWSEVDAALACRLMHDAAPSVGGAGDGDTFKPRCYFEYGADVRQNDEIEVDSIRYAVEHLFSPAEGGTHYTVATVRSTLRG